MKVRRSLIPCFSLVAMSPCCFAWSPKSRRAVLASTLAPTLAAGLLPAPLAHAACLAGDLRPECIGVYKAPVDLSVSKEAMARAAPDVTYVPPFRIPRSYNEAVEVLNAQRRAVDDIRSVVFAGRLEEAGIELLNLLPRVNAAGGVILSHFEETEPFRARFWERRFEAVAGGYGECDVVVGQGLRGELGSLTVAQITVLKELQETTLAFDDLLVLIPK